MQPVLVNSRPLRVKSHESESKLNLIEQEDQFEGANYSSSSGVIICYSNGTGEVITQEAFDDSGIHFIFSKATCIQYPSNFDPIGVGSVVQIFWSRSFERVVRGNHIIVQIEKMEVYKCCAMLREQVFVTFNSPSTAGVAIGVTERNITVAFHPNCSPVIRYETLKAHSIGRTEFEIKDRHRENTNRMVDVILAAVPFRVEIHGNVDKIPFFVIEKCRNSPGRSGAAVITKIMKNHFMEANFLQNSESIYFDSTSCHSNILEKVSIGSLINVLADPTFATSSYKWYGYDVTLCNNYLAHASTQRSFVLENNEILQNCKKLEKSPEEAETTTKNDLRFVPPQPEKGEVKKKKMTNCLKFNSKSAQFKLRHLILDRCFSELPEREAKSIINSYFIDRLAEGIKIEKIDKNWRTFGEILPKTPKKYSESLKKSIQNVLEPFGLNKPEKAAETPKIVEYFPKNPKKRVEIVEKPTVDEIRELFGALMDAEGFALNQRVKPHFVLPDTRWKPTERRYIGKNWIFREKMAFFACFSRLKHEFSKVFCLFFPKMEHFSDLGVL